MFGNDDIMEYAGYRNMIVEDKIEECLAAKRQGAESISIDREDLTDAEVEYLREEVMRRIENGDY